MDGCSIYYSKKSYAAVKKVAKTVASKKPKAEKDARDVIYFVSASKEPVQFDIEANGVKYVGYWDAGHEHLCWRVDTGNAARFRMHHHVQMGRVIEAEG